MKMDNKSKKLLFIGVDQTIPFLLNKYVNEGLLPNIRSLMENGSYSEGFSCPPCDTPTNWTTIATGATTGVHGATSFYVHLPGESFEKGLENRSRSQLSKYCNAQYIWDGADQEGRIPFVANYPSGWSSKFKKGGMAVLIWPIPETLPRILTPKSTKIFSKQSKVEDKTINFAEVKPESITSESEPLEIKLKLSFSTLLNPVYFKSLIIDTNGKGYDKVVMLNEKKDQRYDIKEGIWSDWISVDLNTTNGVFPCLFKIKLLELKNDGSSLKLLLSPIYNSKGWCTPDWLGKELIKKVLSYKLTPQEKKIEYQISGDVASYLQYAKQETDTVGKAVRFAKERLNWDICFFHVHLLDSVNHKELAHLLDDSPIYSEDSRVKAAENVENAYKIVDGLVGYLLENCVDKDTIVAFVSDHGAMPAWKIANIPSALIRAGLLSYKWKQSEKKYVVNWKKTTAFPYIEPPFVWINLEGRDPHGIVKKSKYHDVQETIIDVLNGMRDSETGEKIVKLALSREDAALFGLNGERIGDVVYFLNPPYQVYDEILEQLNPAEISPKYMNLPESYPAKRCFGAHVYYLPSERFGDYSNSVPIILNGPGLKKGFKNDKVVNLTDLAPTFSHLLGIKSPKDVQGRILNEFLE
ncbi:MAG: hypothetical protein GF383_01485 [Candidatus Lokiarchaeota archaeon]|nr:hypothetical protein [Candidatus Lokiarchaeota archaeon]MBD3337936.1 hypothetical protein [Candidatus Lokiarchaeota archaeon]